MNRLPLTKLDTTIRKFCLLVSVGTPEERYIPDAVFLADVSRSSQGTYLRHGFDFGYEKHGSRMPSKVPPEK